MELNFQYAHHEQKESVSQAITSIDRALVAFDEYDWKGETVKAIELQKCSPTLSLLIDSTDHMIWVSSIGGPDHLLFMSECVFPGQVSRFFGFGKKEGIVALHTDYFTLQQARDAFSLFVRHEHDKLRELYDSA